MNTRINSRRRKFVKIFSAALLLIPYSKYLNANPESYDISINMMEKFLANRHEAIQEIGKTYLQVSPEEADKEKLFNLIFPKNISNDITYGGNWDEKIRTRIEKQSYSDFLSGNTTTISGWRLSTTEVRICALSYLFTHS